MNKDPLPSEGIENNIKIFRDLQEAAAKLVEAGERLLEHGNFDAYVREASQPMDTVLGVMQWLEYAQVVQEERMTAQEVAEILKKNNQLN